MHLYRVLALAHSEDNYYILEIHLCKFYGNAVVYYILYNWLIWCVLKLAFFQKKNSLYLCWRLQQSEQRHLYVDIGTNDRRHIAFGIDQ